MNRRHAARLRHYWASLGWAHHDSVDIDLLALGLVREIEDAGRASRFVLTAAGRDALGAGLADSRARRRPHARLVGAVAEHLADTGRLVFTELSVRTEGDNGWRVCKPDVYSLVRGLRPDHLAAQVHEIKCRRSDLLHELRSGKTERYHELAGQIFFVLGPGVAEPDEIPSAYGVGFWDTSGGYRIARDAPRREYELHTRHWMAMARARPFDSGELRSPVQYCL
ncbi:hypothetical protein [Salinisphaera sp. T31B1]|uniref:hypothetical protein n=1 Tax=Salinisphaera sp. T31B1 TaxID=727963 RepID=UPI00334273D6